ncbi:MAG: TraX family protein [Anaerovoracaceae bacterium]
MNKIQDRIRLLSGAQLKYIAFLSMLIDHANKALIYPILDGGALNTVSDIFDIIGRIAFPIFIFLLVEGFFKTRSRWKYLMLLLIFGVISEVPFDMSSSGVFFEPNWNNIMFTLALVLVTIWIIDVLRKKMETLPGALWYILSFIILAVMCFAASNLSLDYEYHAVLIGYFCYIFHERQILAIPFSYISMYKEPWALLGFGLTLTYNGKRGRQYKIINYLFYPVHLLILGLIRLYLGY